MYIGDSEQFAVSLASVVVPPDPGMSLGSYCTQDRFSTYTSHAYYPQSQTICVGLFAAGGTVTLGAHVSISVKQPTNYLDL